MCAHMKLCHPPPCPAILYTTHTRIAVTAHKSGETTLVYACAAKHAHVHK